MGWSKYQARSVTCEWKNRVLKWEMETGNRCFFLFLFCFEVWELANRSRGMEFWQSRS